MEISGKTIGMERVVTQSCIGCHGSMDKVTNRTIREMYNAQYMDSYSFYNPAPCFINDSLTVEGGGELKYKYQHDGFECGAAIDL